jgi:UDP-glucose 4-epimerase
MICVQLASQLRKGWDRRVSMILVVGGLNGFVGSNTTEALVERGIDCVVTRHMNPEVPPFLQKYVGRKVFIVSADATSIADLQKVGEKHEIDGIVNVAGGFKSEGKGPLPGLQGYFDMLSATFRVAVDRKVKRVLIASTVGVYSGLSGTVNEDQPLPLTSGPRPSIAYHKIVEIATSEFARQTGISSVCVRLHGMFGPGWNPADGGLPARLIHAAVSGKPVDLKDVWLGRADDGNDLLYIKDVGRAIALLQTAEKLSHGVYNVGSGKTTSNGELLSAIESAVPGFKTDLPPGRSPSPTLPVMDIQRLRSDTGFSPSFDTRRAVQNYVHWLKAGNPK